MTVFCMQCTIDTQLHNVKRLHHLVLVHTAVRSPAHSCWYSGVLSVIKSYNKFTVHSRQYTHTPSHSHTTWWSTVSGEKAKERIHGRSRHCSVTEGGWRL